MMAARRWRPLTAMLMASGIVCAACATPPVEVSLEPPPKVSPAPSETYLSLGNRLLAAREPALAMRAYSTSLSTEGLSAEALTGAGIAARQQGMLGAARRYLAHARDLAPDSAVAHNNLGVVLLALKEYDGARTAFRAALALTEGNNEHIRRNLERAEAALARQHDDGGEEMLAQRVVRLGKGEFRLIGQPQTEIELPVMEEAD